MRCPRYSLGHAMVMQSREIGLPDLTPWLALKVHPYQHNPRVMQCLPLVVIAFTALSDFDTLCCTAAWAWCVPPESLPPDLAQLHGRCHHGESLPFSVTSLHSRDATESLWRNVESLLISQCNLIKQAGTRFKVLCLAE